MALGEKELIFWVCQKGKDVELRKKPIHSLDELNTFFHALLLVVEKEIDTRDLFKCEDRSLELARGKGLAVKRSPQDDRQPNSWTYKKVP